MIDITAFFAWGFHEIYLYSKNHLGIDAFFSPVFVTGCEVEEEVEINKYQLKKGMCSW
ncbi:hypothetical protein ACWF7H_17660 [Peribacillus butanolivorans]|uniref:hypothetical protein n=1 Tax=Peribacillus butanolivorans TaxID=421767 RepID=UPI0036B95606